MKPQLPLPSTDAQASSAHLTKLIKNEIKQHQNWIPFSRFMELALYTPQYGYYSGGSHKSAQTATSLLPPPSPPYSDKPLPNNLPNYCHKQQAISTNLVQVQVISLPHSCKTFQTAWIITTLSSYRQSLQRDNANIFLSILPPKQPQKSSTSLHYLNTLTASSSATKYWMPCRLNAWFIKMKDFNKSASAREWRANRSHQTISPGWTYTNSRLILPSPSLIHKRAASGTICLYPNPGRQIAARRHDIIDYGFDAAQYYHPQRKEGTFTATIATTPSITHFQYRPDRFDCTRQFHRYRTRRHGIRFGLNRLPYPNLISYSISASPICWHKSAARIRLNISKPQPQYRNWYISTKWENF